MSGLPRLLSRLAALVRLIPRGAWRLALLAAALSRRPRRERIVPAGEPDRRAESLAIALLLGAAGAALAFVAAYALDWPHLTQYLGLALGVSLLLIAAALHVASRGLVVTEELEGDYPPPAAPVEEEQVVQIVHESGGRITRKRFLAGAAGAAGAALGAALVTPLASLGPALDTESLYASPWRRGRRLVDDQGRPYAAAEIGRGAFYTAFPEGADPEQIAAPLVVVRLDPGALHLPADRGGWAPEGILAFSKICTHAGCAISLYRKPLYAPTSPHPALVCPCHYSTFDPAAGGAVIFGPAGRGLPQLPLEIDGDGHLRAAGDFSGPVGPSFWGIRARGPS